VSFLFQSFLNPKYARTASAAQAPRAGIRLAKPSTEKHR